MPVLNLSRGILVMTALCVVADAAGAGVDCSPLPPDAFELPDFLTTVNLANGAYYNIQNGIQFVDINGDSLPDVVYGLGQSQGNSYSCVYLNTGCGWVLQANYTGPVFTCISPTPLAIDLRGIEFPFKALTVKDFVVHVAEFFELSKTSVEVRVGGAQGKRQGPTRAMDELVNVGFHVILSKDEPVYEFAPLKNLRV